MKHRQRGTLIAFTVLGLLLLSIGVAHAGQNLVALGTGGLTGNYYPTGIALGDLINNKREKHGLRVTVETTKGSRYNVRHVISKELDFGLAQSDVQFQIYKGIGRFEKERKGKNLRSVMSLVEEPLYIIARKDTGITEFDDLKGKVVNLGNPGSGQRETVDALLASMGWVEKDFSTITSLKSNEQADALCGKEVDAVFLTVANYSMAIQDITNMCDTVIVPVQGSEVDAFLMKNPYFVKTTIPGDVYKGIMEDVVTFGVTTTLTTEKDVPVEVVYTVVKSVFENLDALKKVNPVFNSLNEKEMVKSGLTAPLHKGASKYYKEAGLL